MAEQDVAFPAEAVPDEDSVYMRAHRGFLGRGGIAPGVFRSHDGGMSVDWSKYSTPEQTRMRAKSPEDNAVIEMNVGRIRAMSSLNVLHAPLRENRAHCDVPLPDADEDLTEARLKLHRIATVVIPVDAQPC